MTTFVEMADRYAAVYRGLTQAAKREWLREQRVEWLVSMYKMTGCDVTRREAGEWVDAHWEDGPW